ncbi:MAG: ornithine carbamoyltransferase [Deltaproteobacteria bacterium]|nr:ornithine carbamoyltransferase [Deltaproteobacteria bacterium]MBW2071913.1 ornithine carbamoyltransferase [Deltaproteobacteria bacterium]
MKRDLLTILDLSSEEIDGLLRQAALLKKAWQQGELDRTLAGRTLALLFDKPSTRTRVSFEVAMYQLGGQVLVLTSRETQLSRQETLADTARVLSRYIDVLAVRTFSDAALQELAHHATIPVINALTDLYHPCQVLSDLLTIQEKKGDYRELRIAWVGDGNNVAHSWINAAARIPFQLVMACPPGYEPRREIKEKAEKTAPYPIEMVADPVEAVAAADVVNTDVWISMGQEEERDRRLAVFRDYQINKSLLAHAKADVIVMHCLPAHRGEEITDAVMDGPHSVVWDQAENRLHFQRALLEWLLRG